MAHTRADDLENKIHPICIPCWRRRWRNKKPTYPNYLVDKPSFENCCFCGTLTRDGYYYMYPKVRLPLCPGHKAIWGPPVYQS